MVGTADEHSRGFGEIRELIMHLSSRIDALDQKVDRFREELSHRIDSLDQRLTGRIDALDEKFSRYFLWMIGIQITILLAVIGALLAS
ncbi:hypothetical protein MYX04_08155 [Nitrospiraceae bacterium AH_259_D15_M11_P09]|nr:hypothetical protein [Nitrospiraceae bacterium AH_259_D15_M11_P09]